MWHRWVSRVECQSIQSEGVGGPCGGQRQRDDRARECWPRRMEGSMCWPFVVSTSDSQKIRRCMRQRLSWRRVPGLWMRWTKYSIKGMSDARRGSGESVGSVRLSSCSVRDCQVDVSQVGVAKWPQMCQGKFRGK